MLKKMKLLMQLNNMLSIFLVKIKIEYCIHTKYVTVYVRFSKNVDFVEIQLHEVYPNAWLEHSKSFMKIKQNWI